MYDKVLEIKPNMISAYIAKALLYNYKRPNKTKAI
jgi:hypothetical protein